MNFTKNYKYFAILSAVIIIVGIVFTVIRSRIMAFVSQQIIYDIRKDLFAHLQQLPFAYYDSRPAGKILVRVINYVNSVSDIFVERGGTLTRFEKGFSSEERLEAVIQHIVGDCNRRINAANPIVDARLVDGSRVCVVTRPISLGGPIITIRRFPKQRITMDKLIAMGSLDAGTAAVLQILVQAGYNIFISGVTGSGKTTPHR